MEKLLCLGKEELEAELRRPCIEQCSKDSKWAATFQEFIKFRDANTHGALVNVDDKYKVIENAFDLSQFTALDFPVSMAVVSTLVTTLRGSFSLTADRVLAPRDVGASRVYLTMSGSSVPTMARKIAMAAAHAVDAGFIELSYEVVLEMSQSWARNRDKDGEGDIRARVGDHRRPGRRGMLEALEGRGDAGRDGERKTPVGSYVVFSPASAAAPAHPTKRETDDVDSDTDPVKVEATPPPNPDPRKVGMVVGSDPLTVRVDGVEEVVSLAQLEPISACGLGVGRLCSTVLDLHSRNPRGKSVLYVSRATLLKIVSKLSAWHMFKQFVLQTHPGLAIIAEGAGTRGAPTPTPDPPHPARPSPAQLMMLMHDLGASARGQTVEIGRSDPRPPSTEYTLARSAFGFRVHISLAASSPMTKVWGDMKEAMRRDACFTHNVAHCKMYARRHGLNMAIDFSEPATFPATALKLLTEAEYTDDGMQRFLLMAAGLAPDGVIKATHLAAAMVVAHQYIDQVDLKHDRPPKAVTGAGGQAIEGPLSRHEEEILQHLVRPEDVSIGFNDIGGLEGVKDSVRETIILPIRRPELFSRGQLRRPVRGLLLYGPVGCGKTTIAKAIAKEAGATFLNITSSAVTSKWHGDSERLIAALFSVAAKVKPCVIFVDEIDALLGTRSDADANHAQKVKNEFTAQWDGLATGEGDQIVVVGATNMPSSIDDAALRRMPKQVLVDMPDVGQRGKILDVLLRDELVADDVDIQAIAARSEDYSGADLQFLCHMAAMQPVRALLTAEAALQARGLDLDVPVSEVNAACGLGLPPLVEVDGERRIRAICGADFIEAAKEVRPVGRHDSAANRRLREWMERGREGDGAEMTMYR